MERRKLLTLLLAVSLAGAGVGLSTQENGNNLVQASSKSYQLRVVKKSKLYRRKGRKLLNSGIILKANEHSSWQTKRVKIYQPKRGKKYYYFKLGRQAGYVLSNNVQVTVKSSKAKKVKRQKVPSQQKQSANQLPNQSDFDRQAAQQFITDLNNYRVKRGSRHLRTNCSWLNKGANLRYQEFVTTFKKTGRLDQHVRPNGKNALTVFPGKIATENEGMYSSTVQVSAPQAANFLFDQFMYHDAAAKWQHRDQLRDPAAKYLSVHVAQVQRDGYYNYLIIVHTGK